MCQKLWRSTVFFRQMNQCMMSCNTSGPHVPDCSIKELQLLFRFKTMFPTLLFALLGAAAAAHKTVTVTFHGSTYYLTGPTTLHWDSTGMDVHTMYSTAVETITPVVTPDHTAAQPTVTVTFHSSVYTLTRDTTITWRSTESRTHTFVSTLEPVPTVGAVVPILSVDIDTEVTTTVTEPCTKCKETSSSVTPPVSTESSTLLSASSPVEPTTSPCTKCDKVTSGQSTPFVSSLDHSSAALSTPSSEPLKPTSIESSGVPLSSAKSEEHSTETPAASSEQSTTEKPAPSSEPPTSDEPAASTEPSAPSEPAPKHPTPEQPTPETSAPGQSPPKKTNPNQPSPESPVPKNDTPDQPAPFKPTPDEPNTPQVPDDKPGLAPIVSDNGLTVSNGSPKLYISSLTCLAALVAAL